MLKSHYRFYLQKVPENLVKEVVANFNKLVKELQAQESPEAMAYLRIMGTELGYIKASDLKGYAQYAAMYSDILMRLIPREVIIPLVLCTTCYVDCGHLV